MTVYPIMLKIAGQRAVVVGGGPVALRKANSLRDAGASVTIVTDQVLQGADPGDIEVIISRYEPAHLTGAKLVFACTNDPAVNAQIAEDARKAGAIINCVDQPADCDFYVPAVVSDGDVVVAISTGGAAPALAGRLKKNIAQALPERIGQFAKMLCQSRQRVKTEVDDIDRRGEILRELASESSYQAFLAGGQHALTKVLDELIG